MIAANVAGAFMWWWILWHLWHEYEHITVSFCNYFSELLTQNRLFQGEFYYPDTSKWTNAELGIPADDEE